LKGNSDQEGGGQEHGESERGCEITFPSTSHKKVENPGDVRGLPPGLRGRPQRKRGRREKIKAGAEPPRKSHSRESFENRENIKRPGKNRRKKEETTPGIPGFCPEGAMKRMGRGGGWRSG